MSVSKTDSHLCTLCTVVIHFDSSTWDVKKSKELSTRKVKSIHSHTTRGEDESGNGRVAMEDWDGMENGLPV